MRERPSTKALLERVLRERTDRLENGGMKTTERLAQAIERMTDAFIPKKAEEDNGIAAIIQRLDRHEEIGPVERAVVILKLAELPALVKPLLTVEDDTLVELVRRLCS